MKRGIFTTEFWLQLLAELVAVLLVIDVIPSDSVWIKVAGVVSAMLTRLGYTAHRSALKGAEIAASGKP